MHVRFAAFAGAPGSTQLPGVPPNQRYARWLWLLLALFVMRVVGQVLVAFLGVTWLPPMEEWYSGLMPYPALLLAQVLIIGLLGKICIDVSRGDGFFARPRRAFAQPVLWLGYVYLAGMIIRYPVRMYLHPEARWFGQTIPIFFHWVLAAFVILFGRYHCARLRMSEQSRADSRAPAPAP